MASLLAFRLARFRYFRAMMLIAAGSLLSGIDFPAPELSFAEPRLALPYIIICSPPRLVLSFVMILMSHMLETLLDYILFFHDTRAIYFVFGLRRFCRHIMKKASFQVTGWFWCAIGFLCGRSTISLILRGRFEWWESSKPSIFHSRHVTASRLQPSLWDTHAFRHDLKSSQYVTSSPNIWAPPSRACAYWWMGDDYYYYILRQVCTHYATPSRAYVEREELMARHFTFLFCAPRPPLPSHDISQYPRVTATRACRSEQQPASSLPI